jgi:hypothetical protein
MNKFRVTCLLYAGETIDEKEIRVFATTKKFATREDAVEYIDETAKDRKPMLAYCKFETSYEHGEWTVYDPDKYDGPGSDISTTKGDRYTELQAVWDFCAQFDLCTVFMNGVPCGGHPMSVPDEGGSGWMRCDGCGML